MWQPCSGSPGRKVQGSPQKVYIMEGVDLAGGQGTQLLQHGFCVYVCVSMSVYTSVYMYACNV